MTTTLRELHSIKKFRGSNLGILRLNHLAKADGMKIKIGDEEVDPISFDTYGHPIISAASFEYYKALKAIKERQGESLVPEVEYQRDNFCIKSMLYDSKEGIEDILDCAEEKQLTRLKDILVNRKKAHFIRANMDTFILYGKYCLYEDGHVYMCNCTPIGNTQDIMELSEVTNFELLHEVHIPGAKDRCAICGKPFTINDVKSFNTTENENCEKVHAECLRKRTEAVNYQIASKIIDTVYSDSPASEVVYEDGFVWYKYHTKQGDLALCFRNKVIEIKWFGKFRPFNLETLFKDEDVTKKKLEDAKVIHAWGPTDAIKYLTMVARL